MQSMSIQLMKIVEVVASITTTEHIDLVTIAISCMHVARTWWLTGEAIFEPHELVEI